MLEKGIALLGMQGIKFDVCHNKVTKAEAENWVCLFMAGNLKSKQRSLLAQYLSFSFNSNSNGFFGFWEYLVNHS